MNQEEISNWYVLLAGLPKPASPIQLASGITLCPLDSDLTVFDLAAAGAAGFKEWAVLEPIVSMCTCEIESAFDAADLPGYDTLNRAWLTSSLLVLQGFSRHMGVAGSVYSWNKIAGHQQRTSHIFKEQLVEEGIDAAVFESRRELPEFRGNILDFQLKMLIHESHRQDNVSEEDASWIRAHFESFNKLASESESFRLALESGVDWRFAKDPRSAVARLWSGIESIFGISSELVYRISLLSASLLERRGESRRLKFNSVKKLYGLRSKIVHGESLPPEKIYSAMNDSYILLRDLLLISIEKGHPLGQGDFDEAVFF